jgi:hypothetical protein
MRRTIALVGSLLLASIGPAGAESIATGCLSQATGEIYNLHLYSNRTSASCEEGDSIVRLAVHQPDTKFQKKRMTIPFGSSETLATFDAELALSVQLRLDSMPFGGEEPADLCELFLFYDEVVYMLASVPPGEEADGLSLVTIFHQDGRKYPTIKNTTGAVREQGPSPDWAAHVHDLYVANRGQECFAAFLLEFADDPAALYSR